MDLVKLGIKVLDDLAYKGILCRGLVEIEPDVGAPVVQSLRVLGDAHVKLAVILEKQVLLSKDVLTSAKEQDNLYRSTVLAINEWTEQSWSQV